MGHWAIIADTIEQVSQEKFVVQQVDEIHGGDINRAYLLQSADKKYFVKLNKADLLPMFEVEALALQALADTKTLRIPQVITYGIAENKAFLVLEYIPLFSLKPAAQKQLGRQLAELHKQKQNYFGWPQDNFIGHNKQINTPEGDWLSFWQAQRLGAQLELAEANGYHGKLQILGKELISKVPEFFKDYQPRASLLHGDLWSGNAAADENGLAVIYDPACYYGDRETDIAMTELFGGFGEDFYTEYDEVYPLDSGYRLRKPLYNLYHILNHLNLFGRSYLGQAEAMMQQLL